MSALRQAATSGVRWSALSQVARQALLLGTLLLLSRLLGPETYGLLSMALTVTGFVDLLKDLGTGAAIVQRAECDEALLSSTFWLNLALGLACAAVVAGGAPFAATYFRTPELAPVLRALSLGLIISSLGLVQLALLQRAIAFRALALVEISASLVGAAVGIGMALAGRGVWSLVGQTLAQATVLAGLAWLCSPWRPTLRLDRSAVRAVRDYGAGLVGFNIANYLIRNADYALVGRVLGAASLGTYTLAYRIMLFPQQQLALVLNRVLFAALARVEDQQRFRRSYLELVQLIATLATPVFVAVFALREPLVRGLLGAEWAGVAPLLAILAPIGLFQALSGTTGLIYQARGRTDWLFAWGVGAGVVSVAAFVVGLRWGLLGVATAYAVATFGLAYPVFAIPFRLIELPMRELLRALLPPLGCGLLMLLALVALVPFLAILPDLAALFAGGIAGCGLYLALSWRFNRGSLLALRAALKR